jgi:hypothetical protein
LDEEEPPQIQNQRSTRLDCDHTVRRLAGEAAECEEPVKSSRLSGSLLTMTNRDGNG